MATCYARSGREARLTRVLIVLQFLMPRIKMRINGAEGGALVVYNGSTTLEQLVQQAKIKLLTDELERASVVDEKVILYLDGGERIDSMDEVCHDDRICVAFTGSGYKVKMQQLAIADAAGDVASPPPPMPQPPPPAHMMASAALVAAHSFVHSPSSSVQPASSSITPVSTPVRHNEPDLRPARPSIDEAIARLQSMPVRAGMDIEIRLSAESVEPKEHGSEDLSSDESDDLQERVAAVIMRSVSGWSVLCRSHPSAEMDVRFTEMAAVVDRLRSGDYRPARPPAPRAHILQPSAETARQRAERRTPEEIRSAWDQLISSGIARPAMPADNPDVYLVESQKDLFCNTCGIIVPGTGSSLFNE